MMTSTSSISTLRVLIQLSEALIHMNRRIPTDPDAKEFKINQLRKSITAGHVPSSPIKEIHDIGNLRENLMQMSVPEDSHLALKSPDVIGCHSPHLPDDPGFSALDLHHERKHCDRCASNHIIKMRDVPVNPFRCWRRGNRSRHYAFLLNQILVPTSEHDDGWSIDQTRQILTGERLKLALQNTRSSLNVLMFPKNSVEYLGRNMMLVTTVQWDVDIAKKTNKSISRVLDVQLIHSTTKISNKLNESNAADKDKLYVFVKEFVRNVDELWKHSGLSRHNNKGILSISIVHSSNNEEFEFLSTAIRGIVDGDVEYISLSSLSDAQLGQFGLDNEDFQPNGNQFSICMFLDPMMDLVVVDDA